MKDKLYKLMNWPEIEAIIYSEDDNPHRLLGPHKAGSSVVFQTFQPGAERVELVFPMRERSWKWSWRTRPVTLRSSFREGAAGKGDLPKRTPFL